MHLSKVILVFGLGLAFASCSKQEPEGFLIKPNVTAEAGVSSSSVATEMIQFSANLDLNEGLRSLEGTKFYRGRLRPQITNNEVQIKVYLGSKAQSKFSEQTLSFKYDEASNSISYRGEIAVPEGLLGASDLKLLMLAANSNQVNGANLEIPQTIKTSFFDNGTFSDGTALPDMKIPYSTGWLDVSQVVDGDKLDVARTKVVLKPLGHVIRLDLDARYTRMAEIKLNGLRIESTAISDLGSYTLPQTAAQIGNAGEDLAFTPIFDAKDGGGTKKIGSIELDLPAEKDFPAGTTQTVFVWVEKIPATSLQAPYNTANNRWTRTFAKIKKGKVPLDRTFAQKPWWDGYDGVDLPVYYTESDFSKKGSTMSMVLDNPKVASPIDRVAYSLTANKFWDRGVAQNNYDDDSTPLNLGNEWRKRQWAFYSLYSWEKLASLNYVGDSYQPITFPTAAEQNSRSVNYRIPTLEELGVILPTQSVRNGLRLGGNSAVVEVSQERVKLGNEETAPSTYSASYKSYQNIGGYAVALGVRFKGGDDRYKTVYQYRGLNLGATGTAANQVQTFYLGSFYPSIQNPDDYRNFSSRYPDATEPPTTSERVLPLCSRKTGGGFKGNTYWVRGSSTAADQATYLSVNYSSGTESVEVKSQAKSDNTAKHTLLLVRDL